MYKLKSVLHLLALLVVVACVGVLLGYVYANLAPMFNILTNTLQNLY